MPENGRYQRVHDCTFFEYLREHPDANEAFAA
jgi:hypothetical protein